MTTHGLKILVADELGPEGMEHLAQAGEVVSKPGMDEETLRQTLPPFHALVVRSATKVTARALEGAAHLAVIGRAGIGVDNIDVDAATTRGIVVMNTPDASTVTTAEHAIALLVSLARNVPAADASMRAGQWEKSKFTGTELRGKTLGVLGLGRIGSTVAELGAGLGMQVIGHDPYVDPEMAPVGVRPVTLDELIETSDFLSIHVPRTEETRGLLDAEALARMKKGARLVNAARGGIVVEDDLCDALEAGHLAGAALDVYAQEPLPEDSRLRSAPNVVLTPHLGASTREAKRGVSLEMAKQIVTCLRTGVALNGLNVPRIPPSAVAEVGPYLALARQLATFLVQATPGAPRSLRLTIQGELPGAASTALEAEMLVGALSPTAPEPVTPVNAARVAEQVGVRVHTETSTLKRDFVNLLRVEGLFQSEDGEAERHHVSGTVLGHRHRRMVELDRFLLDAIPEGPMLVTHHRNEPGVIGAIGTALADAHINVDRVQIGRENESGMSLGILNLSSPITEPVLERLRAIDAIVAAVSVTC